MQVDHVTAGDLHIGGPVRAALKSEAKLKAGLQPIATGLDKGGDPFSPKSSDYKVLLP